MKFSVRAAWKWRKIGLIVALIFPKGKCTKIKSSGVENWNWKRPPSVALLVVNFGRGSKLRNYIVFGAGRAAAKRAKRHTRASLSHWGKNMQMEWNGGGADKREEGVAAADANKFMAARPGNDHWAPKGLLHIRQNEPGCRIERVSLGGRSLDLLHRADFSLRSGERPRARVGLSARREGPPKSTRSQSEREPAQIFGLGALASAFSFPICECASFPRSAVVMLLLLWRRYYVRECIRWTQSAPSANDTSWSAPCVSSLCFKWSAIWFWFRTLQVAPVAAAEISHRHLAKILNY